MSSLGPPLFFLCSILTIAGALGTVLSRNAIRSALSLLVSLLGIAGLYLALQAQVLAAVQLIVYAGAVVVLFVFVVMMLGPAAAPSRDQRTFKTRATGVGLFAAGTLVALGLVWKAAALLNTFDFKKLGRQPLRQAPSFPHLFDPPQADLGSVDALARGLFSDGLVAFELSGLLLLVAIVGVLAITRTRQPDSLEGAPKASRRQPSQSEEAAS